MLRDPMIATGPAAILCCVCRAPFRSLDFAIARIDIA
jgi:hypothetical protein